LFDPFQIPVRLLTFCGFALHFFCWPISKICYACYAALVNPSEEIFVELLSSHFQENFIGYKICIFFYELMIYFVSYVLGHMKRGRDTLAPCGSYATILRCSAFISTQLPFTTEKSPALK
jgi:hypothetical protein